MCGVRQKKKQPGFSEIGGKMYNINGFPVYIWANAYGYGKYMGKIHRRGGGGDITYVCALCGDKSNI